MTTTNRETEMAAMRERLDHCLTCGARTSDVPHHLHRTEDEALHRLAQAKEQLRSAERSVAYWSERVTKMESDSTFMGQVEASIDRLDSFGKRFWPGREMTSEHG